MATESERKSVLRILIATDNHLGVWERDPIRKDDSFRTFEEIFQIAKEMHADLILLGGDLFHDNKPTRHTLVRAMNIIQKYSFNDDPVQFKILSNEAENFVNGVVNFKNGNCNVGLPVFTIHGNHDDPAGVDNLSAVDVLSSCNLVNYFGKNPIIGSGNQQGTISLKPILIEKGNTKVALYGLGNLRDERLGRLFQIPGNVSWARPKVSPGYDTEDWLNVFTIHQNRAAHTQSAKNFIKESYLPDFLDFVLWGHEHECIPETVETATGITVLQPGSSVATALSEGESKKKHVFVLEIIGHSYRTIKQELQSVRPFSFEQVVLGDQLELDADDMEGIATFLETRVQKMIDKANRTSNASSPSSDSSEALLPLIRLRVDYTGFSTINTQRFGQKFVGKVANPQDVLHWHKNMARRNKQDRLGDEKAAPKPETVDEDQIAELVQQNLVGSLTLLPDIELAHALHDFVDKDEKQALSQAVSKIISGTQNNAGADGFENFDEKNLDTVLLEIAQKNRQNAMAEADVRSQRARDHTDLLERTAAPTSSAGRAAGGVGRGLSDEDDEAGPSRPATQRGRGRGRGRGRTSRQTKLGEAFGAATRKRPASARLVDDEDENDDVVGSSEVVKRPVTRRTPKRQAAAKARAIVDDDDDDFGDPEEAAMSVEEVESSDDDVAPVPQKHGTGQLKLSKEKGGMTQQSSRGRKRKQDTIIASSDDDDVALMPPPAAKRKPGTQQTAATGGRRRLPGSLFSSGLTQSQTPSQARKK